MSSKQPEILEVYMDNDEMRKEVKEIHKSLDYIGEQMRLYNIDINQTLWGTLQSVNEVDRNLENANVVDGLFSISRALHHVARAIEGQKPEE